MILLNLAPLPRFDSPPPTVRFLPDGRDVDLLSEIRFYDSRGRLWIAEARKKKKDGASIPRILWPIFGGPYEGFHRDGALLHDDAYGEAPPLQTGFWAADLSLERLEADRMIHEATIVRVEQAHLRLLRRRIEYAKADAIFEGLRLGGAGAWREHARENAQAAG